MRVLLVTTWNTACGIAEHSAYLKEAVERADPEIEVVPDPAALDGTFPLGPAYDLLHLNYQAALHSRWTPERLQAFRAQVRVPIVVTYHDTGVPNSEQCLSILRAADAGVVHEACPDIIGDPDLGPKVKYWRQPVPAGTGPMQYAMGSPITGYGDVLFKQWPDQPVVASIGFPFPWKNYDLLAEASYTAGWALLLIAPNATEAQFEHWRTLNPHSSIWTSFVPRYKALSLLTGCDATAFLYANANTGTSAAIRQGIAARKPVLATVSGGCRQFRDLDDSDAHQAITWLAKLDVDHIVEALGKLHLGRVDPHVVRLAHLDSWERNGKRYAELYRSLT